MKIVVASIAWFLASWFIYDALAFVAGAPRTVTPLVALGVAFAIGALLHLRATAAVSPRGSAARELTARLPG